MKKKNFFAQYKQFTFFLILAVVIILIAVFAPVVSGGVDLRSESVSDSNFWSSCTDFLYRNNTWRDRRIFWRYRGQRDHANR